MLTWFEPCHFSFAIESDILQPAAIAYQPEPWGSAVNMTVDILQPACWKWIMTYQASGFVLRTPPDFPPIAYESSQVVIGFVGNAYLAFLLLLVYYLVCFGEVSGIDHVPRTEGARLSFDAELSGRPSLQARRPRTINPVDRLFLSRVRSLLGESRRKGHGDCSLVHGSIERCFTSVC